MPRLPRIRVEGAIYYVISRGLQNEPIFKVKEDYKMYLELVSKYKTQHKFKLFSYNLLPERLELLIETGDDASISEIMHDINSLYTKYFNNHHRKHGHLFESRFKSILVEKANYLLAMTRHIHLQDKDNAYSSFHIYMGSVASPDTHLDLADDVREVLGFLNTKDDPKAYERYVLEGDAREIKELEKSLHRVSVLGSETFEQNVKEQVQKHSELLKEQAAPRKINSVILYLVGGVVILATASSAYLYISKAGLESKYSVLLSQKEAEFAERAKFENRSPLALTELEGTVWEVEILGLSPNRPEEKTKDKVRFVNGSFVSETFGAQGFGAARYFLVPQGRSAAAWQSAQTNSKGALLRWQGTWRGDAMKGIVSIAPAGKPQQDFSFFSVNWAYAESAEAAGGVS